MIEKYYLCPEILKKLKNMRKSIIFTLAILTSILTFATPDEYKSVSNSRDLLSSYVGSKTHKNLVGGMYRKGNVCGAVMYIDESNKTMKILCLNPDKIIGLATYEDIEEAYSKTPWHLFTYDDVNILKSNYGTMFYNKSWVIDNGCIFHKNCLESMFIKKLEDNTIDNAESYEYFTIAYGFNGTRGYKKYYDCRNGMRIVHYTTFSHMGLCEVPFEPEYVHDYLGGKY